MAFPSQLTQVAPVTVRSVQQTAKTGPRSVRIVSKASAGHGLDTVRTSSVEFPTRAGLRNNSALRSRFTPKVDRRVQKHADREAAASWPVRAASDASAAPAPAAPPAADGISENDAVMNCIKAIMGAGCFALPWAYAQTGLVFTTAYMSVAVLLCLYVITFMQRAKAAIVSKDPEKASSMDSYAGLAYGTMGKVGGCLSEVMLVACIFGVCSAYLVFIASTLNTLLPAYSQNTLVMYVTPLLVMLSWLRSLSGISVISLLGNLSVVLGLAVVAGYGMQFPSQLAAVPMANFAAFPQAFGSVAFLFFVHFALPPIEASMAQPARFLPAACKAFGLCMLVSVAFGAVGAIFFGPGVSSVIITMLKGSFVVTAVKLLLVVNLLSTFPIAVRGAFDVIERLMGGEAAVGVTVLRALRSGFVLLAAGVAIGIPSFGKLLGLVGGVCTTSLTMVIPPLMFYLSYKSTGREISPLELLAVAGIFLGGLGISASVIMGA